MNDSVRLRKELLSLIKELGSPGVLGSMTFRHMDSALHALMKPSKNITGTQMIVKLAMERRREHACTSTGYGHVTAINIPGAVRLPHSEP
ncbi:hypothetical protein CY35_16G007900 [Sphagnum magellanicum]|nr:hypothetical protein CY35_16G007900 [Sphagnum magellanicum]